MKNHLLRPLWLAIALVAIILILKFIIVPSDFGVHNKSFTFSYHRLGNIEEWKAFKVKYKGKSKCAECHEDTVKDNLSSKHKIIECENCHGPAADHPDNPKKLTVDKSRLLCLRCHSYLPYPGNKRSDMSAVDPDGHNPGKECAGCHKPHKPNLEDNK